MCIRDRFNDSLLPHILPPCLPPFCTSIVRGGSSRPFSRGQEHIQFVLSIRKAFPLSTARHELEEPRTHSLSPRFESVNWWLLLEGCVGINYVPTFRTQIFERSNAKNNERRPRDRDDVLCRECTMHNSTTTPSPERLFAV